MAFPETGLAKSATETLAFPRCQRIGRDIAKNKRLHLIDGSHSGQFTLNGKLDERKKRYGRIVHVREEAQHKNLPVGMTPPSDAIKGISARQEITIPPSRQIPVAGRS